LQRGRAEPRATRGGQPRYSALAITTALTLRAVFRLALRQTEGLIASLFQLLGLDLAAPDHSTISRRGETLPVSRPPPGSEPVHLLVDSTGSSSAVSESGSLRSTPQGRVGRGESSISAWTPTRDRSLPPT
jgi:Transposase DDE domain